MDRTITLTLEDYGRTPVWKLAASPDILRRLKRIFPRVRAADKGSITINHTGEVARDLVMCSTRWDFQMSEHDRAYLTVEAESHDAALDQVSRILDGEQLQISGDLEYGIELKPHQIEARDTALTTHGLLVGDELGAGKTFSGLSVLTDPAYRPALAVTIGGAVPRQWEREAQRLYPGLRTHIIRQMAEYDIAEHCDGQTPELLICTYSKLAEWGPRLAGEVATVIFDEVQELRRNSSAKYAGASLVADAADMRIGLSATPIWNRLDEAHNIFRVLAPEVLGGRTEFLREWSDYTGTIGSDAAEQLRNHLTNSGSYLRRTDVVVQPLPRVEQIPVPSDMATIESAESSAAQIAKLILSGDRHAAYTARGQLDMRMRQATGVAKARAVASFVVSLLESRDKVLLFGFHRDVYGLWAEELDTAGITHTMYTGSESEAAKRRSVESFVNGDTRVMMMSLRSSAALDGIQVASSTVVFGELDWAPGVHAQGVGRLRRPGQGEQVEVFWCVTDSGSDPIIMDVHASKLAETEAFIKDAGELAQPGAVQDADGLRRMAIEILQRTDPDALDAMDTDASPNDSYAQLALLQG